MRTTCGASGCGKAFASPESADRHHRASHKPVKRAVGGTIDGKFVKEWPKTNPGYYQDGQAWGEWDHLGPPKQGVSGLKTGVDSALSGPTTIHHQAGENWPSSPCLCDCHYPLGTMRKGSKNEALVTRPCNEKVCAP